MSIDLAWSSLSHDEQQYLIDVIRTVYLHPHMNNCRQCDRGDPCGAIMHIIDLIDAMVRNAH